MKNRITKWALAKQLPKVFSQQCDTTIPRTGDKGASVNCFIIAVDKNAGPHVLANNFAGSVLTGKEWDGTSYSVDINMPLEDLVGAELIITHFYGLNEIKYQGIYDFLIGRLTKWPYITIHLRRFFEGLSQYFFNRRKLVTKQRIDLLKFMIDREVERGPTGIGIFQLMTEIYTIKWVYHPGRDDQRRKLKLYLDSLVSDGELELKGSDYFIAGKAISSIEKYEEEERRHAEQVKLQRRALWLTLIIALFALVQANVIKLPTILDMTSSEENRTNQ